MTLVFAPVISFPHMNAPTLVAVGCSLHTALAAACAAQARASANAVANRSPLERDDIPTETEHAVPVEIPAVVVSCMRRLEEACATLSQARRDQSANEESTPVTLARRGIAGRYRGAWGTLEDQFSVWRKAGVLDGLPEASREALTRVFGASMTMPILKDGARAQWTVGRDTLEKMRKHGVDAILVSLGGGPVLANLQRVHDEVGASFGMTAAITRSQGHAEMSVGEAMTNVRAVLGEYVIKVHAMVAPEVPGSEALAATLLAPLVDLANAPSSAKGKAKAGAKALAKPETKPETTDTKTEATEESSDKTSTPLRPTGTG
jgi:hypothetical protein